jgi:type I restriction enzyme S subunit
MDAKQFLAEFGHVAHAPEGIARLRELIYQLAVTGRLTSQDEKDSDADDVLNNVARIRQQLIAGKKYKRSLKLESSNLVPPAIDLPFNWRWSRLLDLGEINPRNLAEEAAMATFVPMAGVSEKHSKEISGEIQSWSKIHKGYTHFANGDVLLAKITPCFENGKAAVVSGLKHDIGAGSTEFHVFRSISQFIDPGYVYLFLRSPLFRAKGKASMTGTAGQKRLPTDYFALSAMPLPPTAEQARIVAKVDELMVLCDKLEEQLQSRRKLQNALRQSTLQAIANATSTHVLQTTLARLADNFERLFHAPEDVLAFKGLVLDLAVSGKLLNIDNHPVSTGADLVMAIAKKRIEWSKVAIEQEQKEALSMLKKLRTQQVNILKDTLPKHWVWSSLLEVSKVIIDCDHKTPTYSNSGVHLIRTTDIRNGEMRLDDTKKVSRESYLARSRRLIPQAGDIFFTREAPMGEAALVPSGQTVCLGQRLMLIRLFDELFSNRFLIYVIQSPSFQKRLHMSAIGMTVKHINVSDVENLMLPVPPKIEQDRIVTIIDAIFRMCDHYVDQLSRKLSIASDLAICAVSSLTGIAFEQEEEPMKAPQIELIAPLRLGTAPDIKDQAPLATILARHHGEMSAKDLWQRFGGEIDAFYAQLKTEVVHGWIMEPTPAEVREKPADKVSA